MSLPAAGLRGADPAAPRAAALDRLALGHLTLQQDATVGEEKIIVTKEIIACSVFFSRLGSSSGSQ